MKHVVRLGNKHFVTLDSYASHRKTRLGDITVAVLVIAMSAITAGAAAGIDIIQLPNINHHGNTTR